MNVIVFVYLMSIRIQEAEFMEFAEVENRDDYYSEDEGRVHVQDQRGYYVMYDVALKDFRWELKP